MNKDIKQRHSRIKDIRKLDHAQILHQRIRQNDIKKKISSHEEENHTSQSNETTASETVLHSAKRVTRQEMISAINIHEKYPKLKAMRKQKKGASPANDCDPIVQDKPFSNRYDVTNHSHHQSSIQPQIKQRQIANKTKMEKQDCVQTHVRSIPQKANKSIGNPEYHKSDIKTRDSVLQNPKQKTADFRKRPVSQRRTTSQSTSKSVKSSSIQIKNRNFRILQSKHKPIMQNKHTTIPDRVKISVAKQMPEKNIFKKIANSMKKTAKATIKTFKSITMLLSLGGSMIVFILILIVSASIIISSPFSIFFSNDTKNENNTLQHAITVVNKEYTKQIRELKNQYDDVSQTITLINDDQNLRMRDVWQNVLLIYTIQTYDEAQTSFYFDEQRTRQLQDVFFQVLSINATLKEKDEDNILLIQVTMIPYQEWKFTLEEQSMLHDLMDGKNDYLWNSILDGISIGNDSMVETALAEVGNIGGKPYWSWYGFNSRVEWCACFVSWVAEQNGYIEAGIIPKFASVQQEGIPWFKKHKQWEKRGYHPSSGDIIFFDWNGDDYGDHVGIVERSENGTVYTIEGNSLGDECRQREYPINSNYILGYGIPDY